jgi:hypothetical protein
MAELGGPWRTVEGQRFLVRGRQGRMALYRATFKMLKLWGARLLMRLSELPQRPVRPLCREFLLVELRANSASILTIDACDRANSR